MINTFKRLCKNIKNNAFLILVQIEFGVVLLAIIFCFYFLIFANIVKDVDTTPDKHSIENINKNKNEEELKAIILKMVFIKDNHGICWGILKSDTNTITEMVIIDCNKIGL